MLENVIRVAFEPMTAELRRRRLSFSLRTLLIAMALLAVGLGWLGRQEALVRKRSAAKAIIELHGGIVRWEGPPPDPKTSCGTEMASYAMCSHPTIPLVRKWLGDVPIAFVVARIEADIALAQEAFPESEEVLTWEEFLPWR